MKLPPLNSNLKKEERTMNTKKSGWLVLAIFLMMAGLLIAISEGFAETRNLKFVDRVTKMEFLPIPDVEGHTVGMAVFEGVAIFNDGELGWRKGIIIFDSPKFGAGPVTQYLTTTFPDGSSTTSYFKATGTGDPSAKGSFEITHGTGRFQGVKGTGTFSAKFFPADKGEVGWKTIGEGSFAYTLPAK
jgi:hypothetical protein